MTREQAAGHTGHHDPKELQQRPWFAANEVVAFLLELVAIGCSPGGASPPWTESSYRSCSASGYLRWP